VDRGLWTADVRNQIIADKGSVQGVRELPTELKELYKTVWEIKQKVRGVSAPPRCLSPVPLPAASPWL